MRDAPYAISNSVFRGNSRSGGVVDQAAQVLAPGVMGVTIDYTCLEGWTGAFGGVGNHGHDPLFVDADGVDDVPGNEDDDLHLAAGSPGINAGDPAFTPEPGETDLSGDARLQGCRVDLGAYESNAAQLNGDFDGDGDFDLADFTSFQKCFEAVAADSDWSGACVCVFDFDGSGDVDLLDYAAFESVMMGP